MLTASLLVAGIALASQGTPAPTVSSSIEIELFADRTTVRAGETGHVLVEVRNASRAPVAIPGLQPLHRHLDIHLMAEDGERLYTGATYGHHAPGHVVLPPGGALHTHILLGRNVALPWEREDSTVLLSVDLVAASGWAQGLDAEPPASVVRVEGRFSSNLLAIELDRSASADPAGADERRAREFVSEVRRRWVDRVEIASLRDRIALGQDTDATRDRVAELEARSPAIRAEEIRALADALEGSSIVDDAWLGFALLDVWDDDEATRSSLLAELDNRFPGSTGARQARAYLARPDGYLVSSKPW